MRNRFVKFIVNQRISPNDIGKKMDTYAQLFKENVPEASDEQIFDCSSNDIAILRGKDLLAKSKLVYKVAQKKLFWATIKTFILLSFIILLLKGNNGPLWLHITTFIVYYFFTFTTNYNNWLFQNRCKNQIKREMQRNDDTE